MIDPQTRHQFRRHDTKRAIRLKQKGQSAWISLHMVDWSAAGAGLSGPLDQVQPGPALVEIESFSDESEIRLACDIVWREDGKLGLKFLGARRDH
jgi:PilZ domain